jgi:hypothetical protein
MHTTHAALQNSLNDRLMAQAGALGLALLVTLGTLGGLGQIADARQADAAMAAADVTVQQVVVVGQRAPRG